MVQPCYGAHLAEKHGAGALVLDAIGSDHLEGDDAIHQDVGGLVDDTEASAAQLIQDAVLAQHQPLAFARVDPLDLKRGEPALFDHGGGELVQRRAGGGALLDLGQLLVTEKPALPQVFQELLLVHQSPRALKSEVKGAKRERLAPLAPLTSPDNA